MAYSTNLVCTLILLVIHISLYFNFKSNSKESKYINIKLYDYEFNYITERVVKFRRTITLDFYIAENRRPKKFYDARNGENDDRSGRNDSRNGRNVCASLRSSRCKIEEREKETTHFESRIDQSRKGHEPFDTIELQVNWNDNSGGEIEAS